MSGVVRAMGVINGVLILQGKGEVLGVFDFDLFIWDLAEKHIRFTCTHTHTHLTAFFPGQPGYDSGFY